MRVEFLLTAVVGLGALSIDMFLPSLPAIATIFGAAPATVQLTVTLFLMAFAAAQLVYGPLSDRFALMIAGVRETNVRRDPNALRPGQMAHTVGVLLTDRSYLAYVLVNALMFGGQFAFISGSPFVLIEVLGVSPGMFGLCFGAVSLGIMTGTFLSGRFGAALGLDRTIRYGTVLGAVGGLSLAILAWSGVLMVASIVAPMYVFAVGLGLTLPNGMAGAIGPFPRMAGLAAAVTGFIQMTGSALYSVAVGHFYDGTARPMTGAIALAGVTALACFWWLKGRDPGVSA